MQQCHNCGKHVSEQFARVFGDNDDQVFACTDCVGLRELSDGDAGAAGERREAPASGPQ